MIYQYLPVERIHYGINCVKEQLVNEIVKSNGKRLLVVTTNSMLKTNAYKKLIDDLKANDFELYVTCSKQHVPGSVLMEDIHDIRQFNPDFIISCGGGSPIDAAKILSLVLAEGVQSEEELYPYSENVREKTPKMESFLPHIAIPTTLSASEFTSIAGTTNEKDHVKYKFSHLNMTPAFVFLDPVFTTETPEWLWISTGIRAVDHAVETLYTPVPNPVNTSLALQALKKLYLSLPESKKDPTNLEARLECQIGAWLSLFSVVNIKLGLSHSIGHQLGATYNIPHGMTSAIMLPHVMKFLSPRTIAEQAQITEVLGFSQGNGKETENASMASTLIKGLIQNLEIPHRLRDFDVSKDSIPTVVKNILVDIHGEENSFVLNTDDLHTQITALLEEAW
ncbi:iron-containing alcohol dehydrogenase [Bacillus sp. B15-48]|uniref:iron-containing alcohol dehydrogenase n=1 Tax=Bacillus sp. B15-48 TaxID=1548601 RepID=UPI00193F20A6|nr:iron-containing alcohol dehydrogenase [Bacillus sp. B15-48]MBM4761811.1 iron-containing alcohol dehydrogenase [Bacillus sp. B15-48]